MEPKSKNYSSNNKIHGFNNPYIRVGPDYYKKIQKKDRFGIIRTEIKAWKKGEISQDHGDDFLEKIPKYDDFTISPNNFNYSPIVDNCYNLFFEFSHVPKEGDWKWTKILLEHIFGEQYALGLRFLQILYLHPERLMPILVLVSKERQTGKTTFLNWLNMIFGNNMANMGLLDFIDNFNSFLATSNIIAIEETIIGKPGTVEKLKAYATSKFICVNPKYVNKYRLPFFGKFILTSNNEEQFVRIDDEEIRFFIRKVGQPVHKNHEIERDMKAEIPAFLFYLTTLPQIDFSTDRTGFTPAELENESLKKVKLESKSHLYKSIAMQIEDLFSNKLKDVQELHADPISIKEKFFKSDSKIDLQSIRLVLKNEFHLEPAKKAISFRPFMGNPSKTGRPYLFTRAMFSSEPL